LFTLLSLLATVGGSADEPVPALDPDELDDETLALPPEAPASLAPAGASELLCVTAVFVELFGAT
jgi:hypothetical protein